MNQKALLTAQEVAEYFGVTRQTVYNWIKSGLLPEPIKLGRLSRWRLVDIEQRLEKLKGEQNG